MNELSINSRISDRNRFRVILSAALAGAVLLGTAACSAEESGTDKITVAGTLKKGEISICTLDYYPPMDYRDDANNLVGFDVDMMDAVAEKLGVKNRYIPMRFEGLIPGLESQRCDLASAAMYLSDERLEVADAIPYMGTATQLMVASGNPTNLRTLEDLSGKVVAVDAGTTYLAIAQEFNEELKAKGLEPMELLQFPSAPDTFQQIRVGRAEGVIESDVMIGWLSSQEPDKFEYVRFQDKTDAIFAMYTLKGNDELNETITSTLQDLYDDGTLTDISKKYGFDSKNIDSIFAK